MISKKVYTGNNSTKRFLSDFIIRSNQFARPYVFIYDNTLATDGTEDVLQNPSLSWSYPTNLYKRGSNIAKSEDLVTSDKWQVVDNSVLFYIAPPSGSTVWVEVATTSEEFGETLIAPTVERAETAADNAEDSAVASALSASNSLASETAAGLSETASANSASASSGYAVDSSNSATASANSASAANTSKLSASSDATIATTKAAEALASATSASDSASNALSSKMAAATSETNAALSETNAATSASNALASETAAGLSETASALSASNSLASETAAEISETNAENFATASQASATNSAASASASSNSATESSGYATASASSATASSNSASASSTSASAASNSATNALNSANAALTSETNAALSETNAAADATQVAADLIATNQDTIDTAADVITTTANAATTTANVSLTNADVVSTHADVVSTHADVVSSGTNATNAQLKAWEAEAERMTSDSYATEAEDVVVKVYSSNGNGTFTATPTTEYSSLHWAAKSAASSLGSAGNISISDIGGYYTGTNVETALQEVGLDLTGIYTKTQLDAGQLDNRYFTETEITNSLALKANLASPALTGVPTVPTATLGTNTTQAASTAFVLANGTTVNNTLTSTSTTQALSAAQGKVLQDGKQPLDGDLTAIAALAGTSGILKKTAANTFTLDTTAYVTATNHSHGASTIDDNSIGAAELNVSGNGTTAQYLRSDGDGTMTWATPTDTNTWRTITDSVSTTSSDISASATAVKAAYDRVWATTSHTHSYLPLAGGTVTGITSYTDVTDSTSTTTGAIKTSGGVGVAKSIYAGGNVTAYSDKRLKTNIEVIPDALSKVCTLSGYTYDRTDMDLRQTGVIAQEVLKVLPEAVVGSEEEMYGVNYGAMVGLLIESIKELKAEIEELKAK